MTTTDRTAGAIILKDLALFDKAAVYFETEIDPLVRSELGDVVAKWLETNSWEGEPDASDDFGDIWVAPSEWSVEASNADYVAKFWLEAYSDVKSYDIANMFGVGQTKYGFWFTIENYDFAGGSKRAWNSYVGTLSELAQKLGKLGWTHEGKGTFFLPVTLPADRLADAWDSEDWSEALAPLVVALDALKDAMPVFNTIIAGAKQKSE